MKVGAVDADQHKSLGGQYGVNGFPTIKIFGANKNKPEDYQGTANATDQTHSFCLLNTQLCEFDIFLDGDFMPKSCSEVK